jgi:hypothetical protein
LGTDVSFIVGGEVFRAHRAVLAALSALLAQAYLLWTKVKLPVGPSAK